MVELKLVKDGVYNSTVEFNRISDLLVLVDDILTMFGEYKRVESVVESESVVEPEVEIVVEEPEEDHIFESDNESVNSEDISKDIIELLGGNNTTELNEQPEQPDESVNSEDISKDIIELLGGNNTTELNEQPEQPDEVKEEEPQPKTNTFKPFTSRTELEEVLKQTDISVKSYKNYTSKWNDTIWKIIITENNLVSYLKDRTENCDDKSVNSLYNLYIIFFKFNDIYNFITQSDLEPIKSIFKNFTTRRNLLAKKKIPQNATD